MAAGCGRRVSRLSDEQRRRARRRADVQAGAELILLGIALPVGYAVLTLAMFNRFTTTATILVGAGSLICVVLGVVALVRSRR